MKSNSRKCICCGTEYDYCPNCSKFSNKPKWMVNYDNEECKDLFNAVSAYNMGIMDKAGVKAILEKYGISDFSKYKDSIKNLLTELFSSTSTYEYKSKKNKYYTKPEVKDIELDSESEETSEISE